MATNNALFSTMVRAGRTTYFVDVKEAKNGKRYLLLTESTVNGEQRKRVAIRVFSESVEQFRQAIDEAATAATS